MRRKKMTRRPVAAVPAVAAEAVTTHESPFQAWLCSVWDRLKQVAARLWLAAQGLCEFAQDVGRLVGAWLFEPELFAAEKLRFRLKYVNCGMSPQDVAQAVATALAS
jgi:hypothetical protein